MRRLMAPAASLVLAAALLFSPNQGSAQNPNPYGRPNGSWITIGGTVHDLMPNSFALDYGHGIIKVEMEAPGQGAETLAFQNGDTVDVAGRVDDDFLRTETITAGSVYDARLDRYFYASSLDQSDRPWASVHPDRPFTTMFRGMVTSVGTDSFTIDRGPRQVTVKVDRMRDKPLDGEGATTLKVGDYVSVTAEVDHNLFDRRELEALEVTELYHD
jgi:Domain of unknown function (DUF5666)